MSRFHPVDCKGYAFQRSVALSRYRQWRGAVAANHVQGCISAVRVLRRQALAGRKPLSRDYPDFHLSRRSELFQRRKPDQLGHAIDPGETHESLARWASSLV